MSLDTFSPAVQAALPEIGEELLHKLDDLDPSSNTNMILLVISNGEVVFQSTMPIHESRDLMLEACAQLAAEGDNPLLTPEGGTH